VYGMAEARCLRQNAPSFGPDSFPALRAGFCRHQRIPDSVGGVRLMTSRSYDYALNLLSARAYTTRNLRRKLLQKGFEADDIAAAIERLTAARLLDDAKFAEEFARQQLTVAGSSVRRIQQRLAFRGIAASEIKAAIERVLESEPVDIQNAINKAAQKKLSQMTGLDETVRRRRLFTFLARRGFELDDIKRAMESALS
jgi:regulatory protein